MSYTFIEKTNDHGIQYRRYASDNNAIYILRSAYAHDLYTDYVEKYDRWPSSRWYRKHFTFTRLED